MYKISWSIPSITVSHQQLVLGLWERRWVWMRLNWLELQLKLMELA